MEKQVSNRSTEIDVTESYSALLGMRLLQLAGGNRDFAHKMREMLWQAYCDAECPFGNSEKGMAVWWAHSQSTTLQ